MANLLYLDDEPWQLENTVLTFLRKELGHSITMTKSIQEADHALSSATYDIACLDIMMDSNMGSIQFEESGLKIAQWIMSGKYTHVGNGPELPIIIASGFWDITVKNLEETKGTVEEYATSLGIPKDSLLRKPFLADEIENVITRALSHIRS
jgi:CheY-like chemotaxis protein